MPATSRASTSCCSAPATPRICASNVASLLKPPLPEADRAKLAALFGHLTGIGLDSHQGPGATR